MNCNLFVIFQTGTHTVGVNPRKCVGLFKSCSFSELHNVSADVKAEFKLPPCLPREMSVSQDDLNISGVDILPPSPRCVQFKCMICDNDKN